jgi:hypothetical protein
MGDRAGDDRLHHDDRALGRLIGTFVFPVLADLYGRKPILILAILGY